MEKTKKILLYQSGFRCIEFCVFPSTKRIFYICISRLSQNPIGEVIYLQIWLWRVLEMIGRSLCGGKMDRAWGPFQFLGLIVVTTLRWTLLLFSCLMSRFVMVLSLWVLTVLRVSRGSFLVLMLPTYNGKDWREKYRLNLSFWGGDWEQHPGRHN